MATPKKTGEAQAERPVESGTVEQTSAAAVGPSAVRTGAQVSRVTTGSSEPKVVTGAQLKQAAQNVSQAAGIDIETVHRAIRDAIMIDENLPLGQYGMFVVYGQIRLTLPDGTRVVVLPDIHVPAHHKRVLWAVFEFLKDFSPDILVFIGDVCDLFSLTHWNIPPHADADLLGELKKTEEIIWRAIELSGCKHVFIIMGNHEDRLYRWIGDHNVTALAQLTDQKTLGPLLNFHTLLGFSATDPVTFIYDRAGQGGKGGGILLNGATMEFRHGRAYNRVPSAAAQKESALMNRSTISGDSHTLGLVLRETFTGEVLSAKLGYLCDRRHAYFDYTSDMSRTHLGFGVVTIAGGAPYLQLVPIRQYDLNGGAKYAFQFGDKLYVEQSR